MKEFKFSVIIPVYRESHLIGPLIEHLLKIGKGHDYEIIVVDGEPAGSTIATVKNRKVIKKISKRGRAIQMNTGADSSTGEIFIFLHADSRLPDNAFGNIERVMKTKRYSAGAFDLRMDSKNWFIQLTALTTSWRARLSRIPYGDQAIFIRRSFFNIIGQYKPIPIMEDVDLMKRIKKKGEKIVILKDKVITSARRWEEEGLLLCSIRNKMMGILFGLGCSPFILKKFYPLNKSRKKK
ncbi:MAG: TIGR04283 family arsenosugar biosynthesis glycosyltransferase [Spirochaetes bacterium]|nr:TIGR04283 family arsenosugar biosynthesis glycosyltransferase [Spirochaetota bacterium]